MRSAAAFCRTGQPISRSRVLLARPIWRCTSPRATARRCPSGATPVCGLGPRCAAFSSSAGGDEQESEQEKPAPVTTGKKTYYDILEISRRAKKAEIKEAYRKLAKRYHPDRNVDDAEAETKFKEVQEAYATLSEPFKRALYDQDLQFSSYGSSATQDVEREAWTEHWDRETPDERDARRERYRRYAAGERNDLPPPPYPVQWTPALMLGLIGGVFYLCVRAPDWFDAQSDPTFCDPAHDDTSVPLVLAFHDPVMNRWEQLPEEAEPPTPAELYAHYKRKRPELMETLDLRLLPKVSLTTLRVPKTEAAKATFRPLVQAAAVAA